MEQKYDAQALFAAIGSLIYRASITEVTIQIAHGGIHGRLVEGFWGKRSSTLINECKAKLEQAHDLPEGDRGGILDALDRCKKALQARNRIIHDLWRWDEEGKPTQIVKRDGSWRENPTPVETVRKVGDDLDRASVDLLNRVIVAVAPERLEPILDALAMDRTGPSADCHA